MTQAPPNRHPHHTNAATTRPRFAAHTLANAGTFRRLHWTRSTIPNTRRTQERRFGVSVHRTGVSDLQVSNPSQWELGASGYSVDRSAAPRATVDVRPSERGPAAGVDLCRTALDLCAWRWTFTPAIVRGVWRDEEFHLSIGSAVIGRLLRLERSVTVHLDGGVDVAFGCRHRSFIALSASSCAWRRPSVCRGTCGRGLPLPCERTP